MKKIGNWWIPKNDNLEKLITAVQNEDFSCIEPLNKIYTIIENYGDILNLKFETAIDVGAWIGDSSVSLSKKFKNIMAFEPNPIVFECLIKNLKGRNIQNVTLFNVGLSNMDRKQKLIFPISTGSAWISKIEANQEKITTINTRTLDSFNIFKDVDFIKIDVDSHEGFLLEGSKNFFKKNNPLVMIEYKPSILNRQSQDMPHPLIFLEKIGYKLIFKTRLDYIYYREIK
jgi:FkbM family methyltransferase